MTEIDRLVKAAIYLQAELNMVEIEGGLNTLAEFSAALRAMPQTAHIQWEMKCKMEQDIAQMMREQDGG